MQTGHRQVPKPPTLIHVTRSSAQDTAAPRPCPTWHRCASSSWRGEDETTHQRTWRIDNSVLMITIVRTRIESGAGSELVEGQPVRLYVAAPPFRSWLPVSTVQQLQISEPVSVSQVHTRSAGVSPEFVRPKPVEGRRPIEPPTRLTQHHH